MGEGVRGRGGRLFRSDLEESILSCFVASGI